MPTSQLPLTAERRFFRLNSANSFLNKAQTDLHTNQRDLIDNRGEFSWPPQTANGRFGSMTSPYARNRSMPSSVITPELAYHDIERAVTWLCRAFGFQEHLRIANHRAQLSFGDAFIIVKDGGRDSATPHDTHSVMVRVMDINSHYERARMNGARIISPPTDYPFGERQYSAEDPGGHRWTFSQTIADIDPKSWGGVVVDER